MKVDQNPQRAKVRQAFQYTHAAVKLLTEGLRVEEAGLSDRQVFKLGLIAGRLGGLRVDFEDLVYGLPLGDEDEGGDECDE